MSSGMISARARAHKELNELLEKENAEKRRQFESQRARINKEEEELQKSLPDLRGSNIRSSREKERTPILDPTVNNLRISRDSDNQNPVEISEARNLTKEEKKKQDEVYEETIPGGEEVEEEEEYYYDEEEESSAAVISK
jgi:hypothetical protein